jgi:hypothetical protein
VARHALRAQMTLAALMWQLESNDRVVMKVLFWSPVDSWGISTARHR